MLKMTFDRGMATQRVLYVDHIYEYPLSRTLNATYDKEVKSSSDFPDISGFENNPNFTTIELEDETGMQIPVSGSYNFIQDIVLNYYDKNKTVNLTVSLIYSETPQGNDAGAEAA